MRWGLVPFWAKDIKVGFSNINAKAETVDTMPAFREAFTRWRCLLPFDCFYEWRKLGKERQHAVGLADRPVGNLALAGGRARAHPRCCHDRLERSRCRAA
jgi:putative SOS response-associated peptidase YedK